MQHLDVKENYVDVYLPRRTIVMQTGNCCFNVSASYVQFKTHTFEPPCQPLKLRTYQPLLVANAPAAGGCWYPHVYRLPWTKNEVFWHYWEYTFYIIDNPQDKNPWDICATNVK